METGVTWSLQQTPVGQSQHRGLEFRRKSPPSKQMIAYSLRKVLGVLLGPIKIKHLTIRYQVTMSLKQSIMNGTLLDTLRHKFYWA